MINGKNLTTEAAITKLMFLLGKNKKVNDLKISYEKSLRGEND